MTEGKRKILVVDDEKVNRQLFFRIFSEKYDVMEAQNGQEALAEIFQYLEEIAGIVMNPEMEVSENTLLLDLLDERGLLECIPVILLTRKEKRLRNGERVADCIERSCDSDVIGQRTERAIRRFAREKELKRRISSQEKTILYYADQLHQMNCSLIESIADIVEFRSLEAGTHVKRMKQWVEILARNVQMNFPEYRLTDEDVERMTVTSTMHDLGKIMISDSILKKPGKLTADEYERMKLHTVYGAGMIENYIHFQDSRYEKCAWNIARYHHERYDGNGYPDHLKGEQIPVEAQITALADVFDALVSERCYKQAVSPRKAFRMICNGECGCFSHKMLESLKQSKGKMLNVLDRREERYGQ